MNQIECGTVREWLPGYTADQLDESASTQVDAHLAGCDECRSEMDLVRLLRASRAVAPPGLAALITRRAISERRVVHRPWWGISAAAVAALALGIGFNGATPGPVGQGVDFAYETEEGELWLSDDGLLAGAPAIDALSDDALLELVDELAMNTAGGGSR